MKKFNLLLIFFIISLMGIGFIGAATWDNVRSYDKNTKTVTIKNSFLFIPTSTIIEGTLNTPQIYQVGVGYRKVAEFTLNPHQNYENILGDFEFYDLNDNEKRIEKDIDIKYLTTENIEVPKYKEECNFFKNGTRYCKNIISGTQIIEKPKWLAFDNSVKLNEKVTIGLFTNVYTGDSIEWIPKIAGVRVSEWAVWTTSLEAQLVSYYKLDEAVGNGGVIVDEMSNYTGVNNFGINTTGILTYGYDFNGTNPYVNINLSNMDLIDGNFSINCWINSSYIDNRGTVTDKRTWGAGDGAISWGLEVSDNGARKVDFMVGDQLALGATTLNNNTWYMLTGVYDNSTGNISVFVNNAIDGYATVLSTGPNQDYGIALIGGENRASATVNFEGVIDECGYWSRDLNQTEITQLYNGGTGITINPFVPGDISITLLVPANETLTNNISMLFNSTITPLTYNLTNATVYIWYDNGTLFNSTTETLSGNVPVTSSFNISNFIIDDYYWNVFGCQGNGSGNNCSFADNNFTFEWVPFEIENVNYEAFSYETRNDTFLLNITIDDTVSNLGGFLVYNGSSYAVENSCSGGLCQMEQTIDIPLISNQTLNSENKSFHWLVTLFGDFGTFSTNTTTYQQNITNINFSHSDIGEFAVQYSLFNETTTNPVEGDFFSSFNYYLGRGTVSESRNYSLDSSSNYSFFINKNLTFYVNTTIRIENGTQQREYFLSKQNYTNITTNQELFLPYTDVTSIIIEVKDQGLIPLEGYLVKIYRYYPEFATEHFVGSKLTDEFGQIVEKFVENNAKYKFEFYDTNGILKKTSDKITIACRNVFCIIPFIIETEADDFKRYEDIDLFSHDFDFDNVTNTFIFSWDDQTQENSRMRLEVTRTLFNQSSIVCNYTSIDTVSSLSCDVGDQKAGYRGQVFRYVVGEEETRLELINVNVGATFSTYGVEGLFWVFILLMTALSIGAFNPSVGATLYGAGFIVMGMMGLISMPLPVFFANTLIVILFIWSVRT